MAVDPMRPETVEGGHLQKRYKLSWRERSYNALLGCAGSR
jgi:hypothetical protein